MNVKMLLSLSVALILGNVLYGVCAREQFYLQQVKFWKSKIDTSQEMVNSIQSQRGEPGERAIEPRTRQELGLSLALYQKEIEDDSRSLHQAEENLRKCRQNLIQ